MAKKGVSGKDLFQESQLAHITKVRLRVLEFAGAEDFNPARKDEKELSVDNWHPAHRESRHLPAKQCLQPYWRLIHTLPQTPSSTRPWWVCNDVLLPVARAFARAHISPFLEQIPAGSKGPHSTDPFAFFDALIALRVAVNLNEREANFLCAELQRLRFGNSFANVQAHYQKAAAQLHCRALAVLHRHRIVDLSEAQLRDYAITQDDHAAIDQVLATSNDEDLSEWAYSLPAHAQEMLAAVEMMSLDPAVVSLYTIAPHVFFAHHKAYEDGLEVRNSLCRARIAPSPSNTIDDDFAIIGHASILAESLPRCLPSAVMYANVIAEPSHTSLPNTAVHLYANVSVESSVAPQRPPVPAPADVATRFAPLPGDVAFQWSPSLPHTAPLCLAPAPTISPPPFGRHNLNSVLRLTLLPILCLRYTTLFTNERSWMWDSTLPPHGLWDSKTHVPIAPHIKSTLLINNRCHTCEVHVHEAVGCWTVPDAADGWCCQQCLFDVWPGIEIELSSILLDLGENRLQQTVLNLLFSKYSDIAPNGSILKMPGRVPLVEFDFLFAQRAPLGMVRTEWLRQLCATSTKEAADEVSKERGGYLLRLSSVAGSLTLSVGLGEGRAYHHRIGRNDGGAFVMQLNSKNKEEERVFESLWEALVFAESALALGKPAGPSRYKCGLPHHETDPFVEYVKARKRP